MFDENVQKFDVNCGIESKVIAGMSFFISYFVSIAYLNSFHVCHCVCKVYFAIERLQNFVDVIF